jgi:hypothetical protein
MQSLVVLWRKAVDQAVGGRLALGSRIATWQSFEADAKASSLKLIGAAPSFARSLARLERNPMRLPPKPTPAQAGGQSEVMRLPDANRVRWRVLIQSGELLHARRPPMSLLRR